MIIKHHSIWVGGYKLNEAFNFRRVIEGALRKTQDTKIIFVHQTNLGQQNMFCPNNPRNTTQKYCRRLLSNSAPWSIQATKGPHECPALGHVCSGGYSGNVWLYYTCMYFHFISCKVIVWTKDEQFSLICLQNKRQKLQVCQLSMNNSTAWNFHIKEKKLLTCTTRYKEYILPCSAIFIW